MVVSRINKEIPATICHPGRAGCVANGSRFPGHRKLAATIDTRSRPTIVLAFPATIAYQR